MRDPIFQLPPQPAAASLGPDATSRVVTAALVAMSRWTGRSEVGVALQGAGGLRHYRARISEATTAETLAGALASAGLEDIEDADLLLTLGPGEGAAPAGIPVLAVRRNADYLLIEAAQAGEAQLAQLVRDLCVGFAATPRLPVGVVAAAPAQMLRAPDSLRLADWPDSIASRPVTGSCIDMATGRRLDGPGLEARVAALAAGLAARGIGPGRLVGVALPRGIDMVVAWMGALRAGAGFVQLEPGQPADRLAHMIQVTGPALIIGDEGAGPVTGSFGPQVSPAALEAQGRAAAVAVRPPEPDDPAYVIFTSGSTGVPKGVAVPHGSLAHHAEAVTRAFGLGPRDRVLAFAALGFDVAIEEILPTLLSGAALVLRNDAMLDSMAHAVEEIERWQISVLNLPTRFWMVLTQYLESSGTRLGPQARLVVAGGERVPSAALDAWRRVAADIPFMNGYGPTETTITATLHLDDGAGLTGGSVPIGLPLGAGRALVLAPDGSPTPPGRPGELWIGGPGVALGYLGDLGQTRSRFRGLPRGAGDGPGRWYRSGDLVRRAADGPLVFIDRIDRQLKVSGYRIEPGGIEALLTVLPQVSDAHVAAQGDVLTAWVAAPPEALEDIRRHLAAGLPATLKPRLVILPHIPRNSRGKVDESSLQQSVTPEGSRPGPDTDPLVAQLGELMGKVLDTRALRPDESFFAMGGNSLLALRLIERLHAVFGRRPTMPTLFSHPTPRALQIYLAGPEEAEAEMLVPIQPAGDGIPLFGVHVLGVNGSFYQPLARELEGFHPCWGLTVGLLAPGTPTEVDELAELYLQQINGFQPAGPIALAGVSLGAYPAFELAVRLRAAGREVALVAVLDAEGPDLGPRRLQRIRRAVDRLGRDPGAALRGFARRMGDETRVRLSLLRRRVGRAIGRRAVIGSLDEFVAANVEAVSRYRPPRYDGRVIVFAASEGVMADIGQGAGDCGWGRVCADLRVVRVPGNHLSMLEPGGAEVIGRAIVEELARYAPRD